MLKQKLKWLFAPAIAIAMISGLSSFTEAGESAGGQCNLCVVKDKNNSVLFSCKAAANSSCSKTVKDVPTDYGKVDVTVSCTNAVECK